MKKVLIGGREFQSRGSLLKYKCRVTLDLQRECISFRWVEDRVLTSEKCKKDCRGKVLEGSGVLRQRMKNIMSYSSSCITRGRSLSDSKRCL